MKRIVISLIFVVALLGAASPAYAKGQTAWANPATPGQIIAAINAYRAANGLYAYSSDSTLMAVAQGQADYQASVGFVTHEGPGGSRPRDRAIAAGYGGGATVFISEIIYGGGSGTVDTAIEWWKNSPLHSDQMLASTYINIGAGVATNGSSNYYTAVMGYIAGQTPGDVTPVGSGPTATPGGPTATAAPPIAVIIPVIAATPQPDGTIVHIVRTGQALWNIAAVYGVPLADILELNNLPEWAFIHPGDEILVRVGSTDASRAEPEQQATTGPESTVPTTDDSGSKVTATPGDDAATQPTSTAGPAGAIVSSGGSVAGLTPVVGEAFSGGPSGESSQSDNAPEPPEVLQNPAARWVVILAAAAILTVLVVTTLPGRGQARPEDDDPVR
ncbi:MAG: LysM peptidoglycan-binding domain-containing protein [Anaerolineae bacterium]|nr:MAG: LysM peptidoglycan-binding domain-containing protein [Anaerolineae bacterium]